MNQKQKFEAVDFIISGPKDKVADPIFPCGYFAFRFCNAKFISQPSGIVFVVAEAYNAFFDLNFIFRCCHEN